MSGKWERTDRSSMGNDGWRRPGKPLVLKKLFKLVHGARPPERGVSRATCRAFGLVVGRLTAARKVDDFKFVIRKSQGQEGGDRPSPGVLRSRSLDGQGRSAITLLQQRARILDVLPAGRADHRGRRRPV